MYDPSYNKIYTTSFESADDLSELFHEQGHCNSEDSHSQQATDTRIDYNLYTFPSASFERKIKKVDDLTRKEMIAAWKETISEEVVADRKALELIEKISRVVPIFPEDQKYDFQRQRKNMELNLMTYMNASNGWYKEQMSNEELSKLIKI